MLLALTLLISELNCTHKMEGDFAKITLCDPAGYRFDNGMIVDKRSNSQPALKTAGWSKRDKRKVLAETWLKAILHPSTLNPDLEITQNKDGSVTLKGWYTYAPGSNPETIKEKVEWHFDPDARFTSIALERVAEPKPHPGTDD